MSEQNYTITNNEKEMQLEITVNDEKASLTYRYYKKDIAFMHTQVPEALEGKGIAGALAKAAFKYAEKLKKPVMVYCPFVGKWLQNHPEYKQQLDAEYYKNK